MSGQTFIHRMSAVVFRHPLPYPLVAGVFLSLSEPETHHFGQGHWPASPQDLPVSVPPACDLMCLRSQAHAAVFGFYVSAWDAGSASRLRRKHPYLLSHLQPSGTLLLNV